MTITLPRALVQQVLEALDHEIDTRRCKASTLRAMISLRAALAQRKPLVDPAEYDDAGAAERYNRELK